MSLGGGGGGSWRPNPRSRTPRGGETWIDPAHCQGEHRHMRGLSGPGISGERRMCRRPRFAAPLVRRRAPSSAPTPAQVERCKAIVKDYLDNTDPDARLVGLQGDMDRIFFCYRLMKEIIVEKPAKAQAQLLLLRLPRLLRRGATPSRSRPCKVSCTAAMPGTWRFGGGREPGAGGWAPGGGRSHLVGGGGGHGPRGWRQGVVLHGFERELCQPCHEQIRCPHNCQKNFQKKFPKKFPKKFAKKFQKNLPKNLPKNFLKRILQNFPKKFPKNFQNNPQEALVS